MPGKMRTLTLACGIAALLWASPAEAEETCTAQIMAKCTACHYQTRVCEKIGQKSRRAWKVTVKRMLRYGLQLSGAEQDRILDCLQGLAKDSEELCK